MNFVAALPLPPTSPYLKKSQSLLPTANKDSSVRGFAVYCSKPRAAYQAAGLRASCGWPQAVGLKYSTMAAPIEASRKPMYSIGLIVDFGG